MNGTLTLYLDQYGGRHYAMSARELQRKLGGKLSKMYVDKRDGRSVHVGYVVGALWCTAYQRVEKST